MQVSLHRVKFDQLSGYGYVKDVPALVAKATALCIRFKLALLEAQPDYSDKQPDDYVSWQVAHSNSAVVTNEELIQLTQERVQFTYEQPITVNVDPAELFQEMANKNELQLNNVASTNTYNNKCEVHMPGNLMASYNEVQLLEDSCSDVLQSSLSAGWRLIAACPQPDQRRPDYILGRFNPNKDSNDSASRGN